MKTYKISQGYNIDKKEEPMPNDINIICPFCKEDGFDLIGLKGHIARGDCEIYNNIKLTQRFFKG